MTSDMAAVQKLYAKHTMGQGQTISNIINSREVTKIL